MAHSLGCRGRVGMNRYTREAFLKCRQTTVFGPEVVAPGTDAVGLVDGDEGNREAAEQGAEAGEGEALGRGARHARGRVVASEALLELTR